MIDRKLIDELTEAVKDIIDVSYTLQCLNDVAYNQVGSFANMTLSVTQLLAKVIDNATDTIHDVIDAINRDMPEEDMGQEESEPPRQPLGQPGKDGD